MHFDIFCYKYSYNLVKYLLLWGPAIISFVKLFEFGAICNFQLLWSKLIASTYLEELLKMTATLHVILEEIN